MGFTFEIRIFFPLQLFSNGSTCGLPFWNISSVLWGPLQLHTNQHDSQCGWVKQSKLVLSDRKSEFHFRKCISQPQFSLFCLFSSQKQILLFTQYVQVNEIHDFLSLFFLLWVWWTRFKIKKTWIESRDYHIFIDTIFL